MHHSLLFQPSSHSHSRRHWRASRTKALLHRKRNSAIGRDSRTVEVGSASFTLRAYAERVRSAASNTADQ